MLSTSLSQGSFAPADYPFNFYRGKFSLQKGALFLPDFVAGKPRVDAPGMENFAIAASSTDFFSDTPAPQLLPDSKANPLLQALVAAEQGLTR